MNLAILWSHPASYLYSSINSAIDAGAKVFLSSFKSGFKAPYLLNNDSFQNGNKLLQWDGAKKIDLALLTEELEKFRPDVMIISGWNHPKYMEIARQFKGRAIRLLAMDNQWEAKPKQYLGSIASRYIIQPYYDYAFVPGERQYQFAKRLGFGDDKIIEGLFTCDISFYQKNLTPDFSDKSGFVYVGRLSREKGIDTLLAAYDIYSRETASPWELNLYGVGDGIDSGKLPDKVRIHGFIQPDQLPGLLQQHKAFIMPSHWEPWGVAIHEAASAGLPLICSVSCGSAVHLVKNNFNGFKFKPGDAAGLADAMLKMNRLDNARLSDMSINSKQLAAQFHPSRWFTNLVNQINYPTLAA